MIYIDHFLVYVDLFQYTITMSTLVVTPTYQLVEAHTTSATITFYRTDKKSVPKFVATNKQLWHKFSRSNPHWDDTIFYMASLASDRAPFVLQFTPTVMAAVMAEAMLYFGERLVIHGHVDDTVLCRVKMYSSA